MQSEGADPEKDWGGKRPAGNQEPLPAHLPQHVCQSLDPALQPRLVRGLSREPA